MIEQLRTETSTAHVATLPLKNGIAIHSETRNMHDPTHWFNSSGDDVGSVNDCIGHDGWTRAFQIDSFWSNLESVCA